MDEIILHHYTGSLFAEKIRLLLGYLELPWHSVIISPMMPRPLLMPLTGGYRKTPVLQVGADIYCDTQIIARALEVLAGGRRLHGHFAAERVAEWADSQLFRVVVGVVFQPRAIGEAMRGLSATDIAAFAKDRAELAGGAPISRVDGPVAEAFLAGFLSSFAAAVASSPGDFLFGTEPRIADFSIYHCLWFVEKNPVVAPLLRGYPQVEVWQRRMQGFGHGEMLVSDAEQALAVARQAEPARMNRSAVGLPTGIELGMAVQVTPTDYGKVPVSGCLVACDLEEIVVRREPAEVLAVQVHFPRNGFSIEAAK